VAALFVVLLCYVGECLKVEVAVELGIVRACKRDSLRQDLIMEPHEGFGVALDGTRVVGCLGSVLVLNDAQFELVGLVSQWCEWMLSAAVRVSIGWL
jgi:hypothetical protein